MLHQNNSILTIRNNRFDKKNTRFQKSNINTFNFENGLHSIKDIKNNFINFAKSENEEEYNEVVNDYICFLNRDNSFLNNYIGDEIIPGYRADRLLSILSIVNKQKYKQQDLPSIIKLKNNHHPKLHYFIKKSRNNFKLILVDLYHLAVFGEKIVKGKTKIIPIEKIYRKNKDNTINLEIIKKLKE